MQLGQSAEAGGPQQGETACDADAVAAQIEVDEVNHGEALSDRYRQVAHGASRGLIEG